MKWAVIWVSICFLAGCATYKQDIDAGLSLAKEGEWKEAEGKLEGALDSSQDKLLYYMEIGALAQNQG
ncbi:MAG: hypothetical protein KJ868_16680, partial [Gammaproteobacteria bacterium]|nr:hypothetical protein [Gammaproteobacteria bacterium]